MTRHVVIMTSGPTTITYDGKATDAIAALLACVRTGPAPAGIYDVEVGIYGRKPSTGRVGVRVDGSITVGTKWGLPAEVKAGDEVRRSDV